MHEFVLFKQKQQEEKASRSADRTALIELRRKDQEMRQKELDVVVKRLCHSVTVSQCHGDTLSQGVLLTIP